MGWYMWDQHELIKLQNEKIKDERFEDLYKNQEHIDSRHAKKGGVKKLKGRKNWL